MNRVGYTRAIAPEKVALTARRALQLAEARFRDIDALRGMLARVDWALSHPELDWTATKQKRGKQHTEKKKD
jgi:tRNA C32,U32 (ribose-2'-O)-methylase TrmJ